MKAASWRLYCQQLLKKYRKSTTYPRRTAPRQMSKTFSSLMLHSPSDKKITTGALQCMSENQTILRRTILYLSVLQFESMIFCALSRARVKFVPRPATFCMAAVSSSSGVLAKSFSMQVEGSLWKRIKLYASLLVPPNWVLRSTAAWRASQKLYRAEKTDPSLLFALGVMRSTPAELASGCRSHSFIELDLDAEEFMKK